MWERDGKAYSGSTNGQNTFNFQRVASFSNVVPNTSFKLGTLTYHNGTINSGTGSTGLDLRLTIDLTTPDEPVANGDVMMSLVNTSNIDTGNNSQSADQCTIITPSTNFYFTYGGVTYTLAISYGNVDISVGVVVGNTLAVWEGATATVDVYGTFVTTTPP